jgi:hypothetical protein
MASLVIKSASADLPNIAESDREERKNSPCQSCRHFGDWIEIASKGEIRTDLYAWCNLDKRIVAKPDCGCTLWASTVLKSRSKR